MAALLAPDAGALHALINFYARKKYYHHVHTAAVQSLTKRANDPVLLFWKAWATWKEGNTSDAIRDLNSLRGKQGIQLPVLICLKAAHESAKMVDREAVQECEQDIHQEEKGNREGSFFLAANVCMLQGDRKHIEKARKYIEKTMEISPSYPQSKSLSAWIELRSGSDTKARKSLEIFKQAVEQNPQDVDPVLGQAAFFEHTNDHDGALEILNKILASMAWFTPAASEKARILLAMHDWEQAVEAANRSLTIDANNIDALILSVVNLLAKESKYSKASDRIAELLSVLQDQEPNNAPIYCECAALFSRLCARKPAILTQCIALINTATQLDKTSTDFMTEMGNIQLIMGQPDRAINSFQQATKLDEANMTAMYGMIKCQILMGQLDDAAGQFEFLNEIHGGSNSGSDLAYIGALLASKKDKDSEQTINKLQETVRVHLEGVDVSILTYKAILKLDPDFLLSIARELLDHAGSEPVPPGEPPTPVVSKGVKVLEPVSRVAPGMLDVQILLAKARYLSRDFEGAQSALTDAIQMDPSASASHMLMAQIFIEIDRFADANSSLEQALSHDFEIRESPTYFLLKAMVHERSGQWEEALKVLEGAMKLPGIRGGGTSKSGKAPSQHERASIFLHQAKVYAELGRAPEASKIIQDAKGEFNGTPQHAHIIMVDSELALKRGDVHSALVLLKGIPQDSPHYMKAKVAMANIHLTHRHNKKLYIRSFEELVDRNESVTTLTMLAEAYMKLHEADKAVEVYRRAYKLEEDEKRNNSLKGGDSELAVKLGQALVSTHDFAGAVEYYRTAVKKQPQKLPLRLSLAELHMRLDRTEDAIQTLEETRSVLGTVESVENLSLLTKVFLMEAKVYKRANMGNEYTQQLMNARMVQSKILGRLRGEGAEMMRQQKKSAASICSELAKYYEQEKNYPEALKFYAEALKHDEKYSDAMLSLARLHMDREELNEARQQCTALLKYDLETEKATMMLADIMFRSNEFDEAIRYFAQMLEQKPNNYKALEQLILLVRRAGRLSDTQKGARFSEAPRFLRLAERSSARANLDAGFHYCKGLYARYTRNFADAISEFNQARKDGEWGRKAIGQMIEVYLDPDNLSDELNASHQGEPENVKMARQLRLELTNEKPVNLIKYEAYEMLLTQTKMSVDASVNKFSEMLNYEKDSVAALLGMSYALRLLKQDPKARNHLKRISKMQYNSEEADDFERSYLLLADMYIQSNKNDLAQELCRKCLTHNKSCAKAWEYQGLIYEKEASYADAAQVYEMAWQFDNQRNPAVGYKLAFNYLKAKRYVDAINICHLVLKIQPNYIKIQQEILNKARGALRP